MLQVAGRRRTMGAAPCATLLSMAVCGESSRLGEFTLSFIACAVASRITHMVRGEQKGLQ